MRLIILKSFPFPRNHQNHRTIRALAHVVICGYSESRTVTVRRSSFSINGWLIIQEFHFRLMPVKSRTHDRNRSTYCSIILPLFLRLFRESRFLPSIINLLLNNPTSAAYTSALFSLAKSNHPYRLQPIKGTKPAVASI